MENSTNTTHVILASQSPRRRYLLEQAGLNFEVMPSGFDESSIFPGEPAAYARIQAEAKAGDLAGQHPDAWVIGADTIVVIDGVILGKPASTGDAREMLQQLSGHTHQVMTGYSICNLSKAFRFSDTVITDVEFKKLADAEIEWYVQTGEPFDKAGAYAIQGIGTFLVRRINGSYTNVVGLPVCEVLEVLIAQGVVDYK
jgi:septum formation protein